MKIKDIIKMTALMLNRKEICDYLDGNTQDVSSEILNQVETMTGLTNLVINELACTYVPMVKTKVVTSVYGKVYYSAIDKNLLKVRSVYSLNGNAMDFTQTHEYMVVQNLQVVVEYEYCPPTYQLDEQIGYAEKDVPARVIAYGLMAEFALCEGRFDEAITHHKRYVDNLATLCCPKNANIKKRSWA